MRRYNVTHDVVSKDARPGSMQLTLIQDYRPHARLCSRQIHILHSRYNSLAEYILLLNLLKAIDSNTTSCKNYENIEVAF